MDVYIATKILNKKRKEDFTEDEDANYKITPWSIVSFIISLAIGSYAVYLSWTCNTAGGWSTPAKVIFAFFAFLFGIIYLIFYLLVNAGRCGPQK